MAEHTGTVKFNKKDSGGKTYWGVEVNGKFIGTTWDADLVGEYKDGDFLTVTTEKNAKGYNAVKKAVFAQGKAAPLIVQTVTSAAPEPARHQNSDTTRNIQLQVALKCAVELINGNVATPEKNTKASLRTKEAAVKQLAASLFQFLQSGGKVEAVETEVVKATEAESQGD